MIAVVKAPYLGDAIFDVTRTFEPQVSSAFLRAVAKSYSDSGLPAIVRRIERGETSAWTAETQRELQAAAGNMRIGLTEVRDLLTDALTKSGASTMTMVTNEPFSFTYISPQAVQWAKEHSADWLQATKEVRQVVRRAVARAVKNGTPPYALADRLERIVGLTDRQAVALDNYYESLIRAGRSVPEAVRLAREYSQRMLSERALTIARTELIRATNAGQREALYQAKEHGYLDDKARLEWITTADEMTCPTCRPLNGKRIPLDGEFTTAAGKVPFPPAHPRCRCTVGVVSGLFNKEEVEKAKRGGRQARWPKGDSRGGQFRSSGTAAGGANAGGAETKNALRKYEAQIAKHIAPGAHVDLTGISPASARTIAKSVRQFGREFPAAARSITEVTTRAHMRKDELMAADVKWHHDPAHPGVPTQSVSIKINPKYTRTPELAHRVLAHPSQAGWHPYSDLKGVTDHELGHVVSSYASPPTRSGEKKWLDSGWPPAARTFDAKLRSGEAADRIGDYASSSPHSREEAFAELFAMRQSGKWNFNNAEREFMTGVIGPARFRKEATGDVEVEFNLCAHFIKPGLPDEVLEEPEKTGFFDKVARRTTRARWPAGSPGGKGGEYKPGRAGGAAKRGSTAKRPASKKAGARRAPSKTPAPKRKPTRNPDLGHGHKGMAERQRLRQIARDRKNKEGVTDRRLGGGQRPVRLKRPDGKKMEKTEMGEVMEALTLKKLGPQIARKIGGGRLHHSASQRSKRGNRQNTATVDLYNNRWGIESKAVSETADGGNPKVTIRKTQLEEKLKWGRDNGRGIFVIVPRVMQNPDGTPTGHVIVHGYEMKPGSLSKRAKAAEVLGEFDFKWSEWVGEDNKRHVNKGEPLSRRDQLRQPFFGVKKGEYIDDESDGQPGDLVMQWDGENLMVWIVGEDGSRPADEDSIA